MHCYNTPRCYFAHILLIIRYKNDINKQFPLFIPNLYRTATLFNGNNLSVPWVTVIGRFHCTRLFLEKDPLTHNIASNIWVSRE